MQQKYLQYSYNHEKYGHQNRNIAYTQWGNPDNKNVVICVHGLTLNSRFFDYLAAGLQDKYRVICVDVVGRGKSSFLNDPTQYDYSTYIPDMKYFLDNMKLKENGCKIFWVGTSMGGLIGMFLQAMYRDSIDVMVINDVGPHIPLESIERISKYIGLMPLFEDIGQYEKHLRKIYEPFGIKKDEHWAHIAEVSHKVMENGMITFMYDPNIAVLYQNLKLDKDFEIWDIWDRLNIPIHVIRAEYSDILTQESYEKMISKNNVTGTFIKGIGHVPALMEDDQIEIVRKYLDAHN